jgi:hypothetical protein
MLQSALKYLFNKFNPQFEPVFSHHVERSEAVSFHKKAYVCIHVFENVRPVLVVSRDLDDWCFLCGDHHPESGPKYRAVGMGHVLARIPDLNAVLDLEPNQAATRIAIGKPWFRVGLNK